MEDHERSCSHSIGHRPGDDYSDRIRRLRAEHGSHSSLWAETRSSPHPESRGPFHSIHPSNHKRAIEVKGRAGRGDVEVSANEWAKACNMRDAYWLYAVYDCAAPTPRLVRVQDPFGRLLAKAKGRVLIGMKAVTEAAQEGAG